MSTLAATNLKNPSSGSNNIVLGTDGSTTLTKLTGGALTTATAVNSTSGVSIDFTGIPSWVKRVTVMFSGVSTNGTSTVQIQLGTGATPTFATSGYLGSATAVIAASSAAELNTNGFRLQANTAAASTLHGISTLCLLSGNTWTQFGMMNTSDIARSGQSAGSISLAAALTAVRITTVNGTDTFDAGSINILYEG
jgi:hypothetical protein